MNNINIEELKEEIESLQNSSLEMSGLILKCSETINSFSQMFEEVLINLDERLRIIENRVESLMDEKGNEPWDK